MNTSVDLSVIISHYNGTDLLLKTLRSLKKALAGLRSQVIVVDDHSEKTSAALVRRIFPHAKVIRNKQNLGYSKSYNKGTRVAVGRYILHLNSDVIFLRNRLKKLLTFMDKHPTIGIVGPKIIKLNGKLDLPCRRSFPTLLNVFFQTTGLYKLFPNSKLFGHYYLTYKDENKSYEVECIMGAFSLFKKEVIEQIGLMDERFFIYGEDIDHYYRAHLAGWKLYYYSPLVIQHQHGATTSHFKWKHIKRFHRAMHLYYDKHFTHHNILLQILTHAAIEIRFIIFIIIEAIKSIQRSI